MEYKQITETCSYFHGNVNVGYIKKGNTGLLIDAGLDEGAAKKITKILQNNKWPLTHLFITHAHADHYGGASYLQKKFQVSIFAPKFEEAILSYPKLESIYLFNGVEPPQELRNKFIEGNPIHVDVVCEEGEQTIGDINILLHPLPGHSYGQLGLECEGILYAADAYFDKKTLHKHNIPFVIDVNQTIESLKRLMTIDVIGAVPGHGVYEENYQETIQLNIEYHLQVKQECLTYIQEQKHVEWEQMSKNMCTLRGIQITNITSWALYRTAVAAYVQALVLDGKVEYAFVENSFVIKENKNKG
ncbi:MBL fold metallo-hydrolase [Bacillus alkalicellulosilyticus]|uniref:MBL fold metallo-hydrolase n=1 Tax=Alkalihalobacterium alkalicellulosilyticum TaxID=1912214 RepID=UPI0009977CC9|nr:MBL fold metallo-hydrolase [Bacillus alkalicellulosilyticus]